MGLRLDALGDDLSADVGCEPDQRRCRSTPRLIARDRADQGDVELDELGGESEDAPQAGEASARIVDGQAHPPCPELADPFLEDVVVLDRRMLGDLDDHPPGRDALQGTQEPR